MLAMNFSRHQIEIKGNAMFFGMGIAGLGMGAVGITVILGMLPFEDGNTFANLFGLGFMCVWTMLALGMGLYSLSTNKSRLTLNDEGIFYRSWFGSAFLHWNEVQDYGLSYYGKQRGGGNLYYLYFSDHVCPPKNECRKKLRGRMIKVTAVEGEYYEALRVLPFCRERTSVEPFIGEDKFHFL